MSSEEPRLRDALPTDSAAIQMLCQRLDPADYVIETWESWMVAPASVHLVAEVAGRIAGCVRAEAVAPGEAFSQGLRVDPEVRGRGIAGRLMSLQNERLRARGVHTMRGVTAAGNRRARHLFARIGAREVSAVARRRLHGWRHELLEVAGGAARDQALETALRHGIVLSRVGRAHFQRIYTSASRAALAEAVAAGRVIDLGGACAVLDPRLDERCWITALAGAPEIVAGWLDKIARARPGARGTLVLEAADEPHLQQQLDRLEFEPAGKDDRYVVIEMATGAPAASSAR